MGPCDGVTGPKFSCHIINLRKNAIFEENLNSSTLVLITTSKIPPNWEVRSFIYDFPHLTRPSTSINNPFWGHF